MTGNYSTREYREKLYDDLHVRLSDTVILMCAIFIASIGGSSCKRTKKDHRMIQLKHKTAIIPTVLCFSSKKIGIIPIINCTKKDHRISKDEHS